MSTVVSHVPNASSNLDRSGEVRIRRVLNGVAASISVAVALAAMVGAAPLEDSDAAANEVAAPPRQPPAQPRHQVVVALGDSVPAGTACGCRPFPQVYGSLLEARTGAPVTVENHAVSGLDTAGLLAQLHEPQSADAVRRADVVLLTIGANDFEDHHDQVVEGVCGTGTADCVRDEVASMKTRLAAALAGIRTLRQGRPTSVLVTGYWNVFEDGDVAQHAFGAAGLDASIRLTRRANSAISSVSTAAGAHYVDLFGPFQRRGRDITTLMAADGDHPDAAGHRLIAGTLLDAGLPRLP